MGISVAVFAWVLYAREKRASWRVNKKILTILLFVLIMVTGHLGGSLTHGSDYLTKPLSGLVSGDSSFNNAFRPIPDVQEAFAYNDVVKPILQTKCYSCHGPNKQKGKLRMDDEQLLLKGGKDGKVIEPGNAEKSEMIKRLLLPVDNEDHMPPKEKPQPTESQISLLHWWISNGADFSKKINEISQPEKVKPLLLALQKAPEAKSELASIPSAPVEKADEKMIDQLKQKGIVVLPVAQNSNYLSANFITHAHVDHEDVQWLLALKKQLIWLKLSYTDIGDANMATIGQLTNLTRLSLDHTLISDSGIVALKTLSKLEYLNLVNTKLGTEGILQLKDLKALRSLFLYQTRVAKADWANLKTAFSKTAIDSGGYSVETLPTDTMQVKAKKY